MARSLSTVIRLLCALFVTSLVFLSNASATNIVFDNLGNMVGSYVGSPSKVMDFIASGGRAGGAIGTSGALTVATDAGGVIVTAAADFSPSVLAKMARIGMRGLGPLGAALTAYQIYGVVKDSGLQVCPPPDFFCKPDPSQTTPAIVPSGWISYSQAGKVYSSPEAGAMVRASAVGNDPSTVVCTHDAYQASSNGFTDYATCSAKRTTSSTIDQVDALYTRDAYVCPSGSHLDTVTKKCNPDLPKLVPVSDPDLEGAMTNKAAGDPSYLPRVLPALQNDSNAQPGLIPPNAYLPPDLPVTVSGSPVTGPPHQVSSRTFPNADGSTSTETITSQSTVTPTKTGGDTMSTSNTTFPTTTTVTTTTVNNTTNVTTTSTTIINPPVNDPSNKQPGKDAETGPKECGSPGKPKCAIDEAGTVPPAKTGDASQATVDAAQSSAMPTIAAAMKTDADTGWGFTFELPSQCSSFPMFLNIVIDFCRFQPMVHDIMSMVWVMTTGFLIIGMFGRTFRG